MAGSFSRDCQSSSVRIPYKWRLATYSQSFANLHTDWGERLQSADSPLRLSPTTVSITIEQTKRHISHFLAIIAAAWRMYSYCR